MKADVAIGALLFALSAAMFGLTFTFPNQTIALPPTAFPRFVTICMAGLAVVLIVQARRQPTVVATKPRLTPWAWLRQGHILRVGAMAALGFVYTQVVDSLGFLIATGLFLAAAVAIFMERRWTVVLSVAVIGTGTLYGVFRLLFRVPLPRFDLF